MIESAIASHVLRVREPFRPFVTIALHYLGTIEAGRTVGAAIRELAREKLKGSHLAAFLDGVAAGIQNGRTS